MSLSYERSREARINAADAAKNIFSLTERDGVLDAMFLDSVGASLIAFLGLPYRAPICARFLSHPAACAFIDSMKKRAYLFIFAADKITLRADDGEEDIPSEIEKIIVDVFSEISCAKGVLADNGNHIIDLKMPRVGTHFDINLLLGCRVGFSEPLLTTPKSSLDAFGRGAFRSTANINVTASRFDPVPENSGESANRQFYIYENGEQIFYSADAKTNIEEAFCSHSQNHTVITYQTKCGLIIRRTIFILPYEEDMPDAVEAQRIEITNMTDKKRELKVVATGMFALCSPESMQNDILYASITYEGAAAKKDGRPIALCPSPNPLYLRKTRRFVTLFSGSEPFDEYTDDYIGFIGRGTLEHPEHGAFLKNENTRKVVPFFALSKKVSVDARHTVRLDEYTGIVMGKGDITEEFLAKLERFTDKYSAHFAFDDAFAAMKDFYASYSSYINIDTGDKIFDSYVNKNLPFQVLYQSFVSRSFAWTQKSFREIGFREIQDVFASLYYMNAMGNGTLARALITKWAENVYEMGYANHNFFFAGKEPGFCSDDALWLSQAVSRYVFLTGDFDFLNAKLSVAGSDKKRTLWDTMLAIVEYSGKISIGAHNLPMLDRADWNDALKLDDDWIDGTEKERRYREQLEKNAQSYGVKFENNFCESVMNAFLLKIAYDAMIALARASGRDGDADMLAECADKLTKNIQEHAWKENFFARALINHGEYTYVGAKNDGLGTSNGENGSYFLNSYSWALLSDTATEEQIGVMLDTVKKHLLTKYGPVLCTPCDLEKIASRTATGLYFRGDRENGGVFKHAAMMAAVASFKASKTVKSEALAYELADFAYGILENVLPAKTMNDPFVTKGNPRFCTQYTNSETGESVGPMLSGTASWLTLAVFEMLGIEYVDGGFTLSPMLPESAEDITYTIKNGALYTVNVKKSKGYSRKRDTSKIRFDGKDWDGVFPIYEGGEHKIEIEL